MLYSISLVIFDAAWAPKKGASIRWAIGLDDGYGQITFEATFFHKAVPAGEGVSLRLQFRISL